MVGLRRRPARAGGRLVAARVEPVRAEPASATAASASVRVARKPSVSPRGRSPAGEQFHRGGVVGPHREELMNALRRGRPRCSRPARGGRLAGRCFHHLSASAWPGRQAPRGQAALRPRRRPEDAATRSAGARPRASASAAASSFWPRRVRRLEAMPRQCASAATRTARVRGRAHPMVLEPGLGRRLGKEAGRCRASDTRPARAADGAVDLRPARG
jgi:hypothetical protein